MSDILGKDGKMYWWVGEVVNRMDPLHLGRCQVKIFGWHDDGEESTQVKMQLKDYPWAQPMMPCNTGTMFNSGAPNLKDWVVGFFLDGPTGMFPVMWGVLPAFNPSDEDKQSFNNVKED